MLLHWETDERLFYFNKKIHWYDMLLIQKQILILYHGTQVDKGFVYRPKSKPYDSMSELLSALCALYIEACVAQQGCRWAGMGRDDIPSGMEGVESSLKP